MSMRVYTYEQLLAAAASGPRGWLLRGMLPICGIVLLAGKAFAGKSTFLAALFAAMSGTGVLAGRRVEQGHAIHLALEHRLEDWERLYRAAASGAGLQRLDLSVVRPARLDDPGDVRDLIALCEQRSARLVAVDSFRRAGQFTENNSEDIAEMGRIAAQIADEKRLVILTHHAGHNGKPRGSTDLQAMSDSVLFLSKQRGVITVAAEHHGAPPERIGLAYSFDHDRLVVSPAGPSAGAAALGPNTQALVLQFIAAHPGCSKRAIRENVAGGNGMVDSAIDFLFRTGAIANVGTPSRHQWVVASSAHTGATAAVGPGVTGGQRSAVAANTAHQQGRLVPHSQ